MRRFHGNGDDFDLLTPREFEVLKLIAEGHICPAAVFGHMSR